MTDEELTRRNWKSVYFEPDLNVSAIKIADYLSKMTNAESRDSKIVSGKQGSGEGVYVITYSNELP